MTSQITYTQTSGGTAYGLNCNDLKVTYMFPQKEVKHQDDKVGVVCDPNRNYRVITGHAKVTGAEAEALDDLMMPASAPTYTAAHPSITIYWTGAKTETIEVIAAAFSLSWAADNAWWVEFNFEEKTK